MVSTDFSFEAICDLVNTFGLKDEKEFRKVFYRILLEALKNKHVNNSKEILFQKLEQSSFFSLAEFKEYAEKELPILEAKEEIQRLNEHIDEYKDEIREKENIIDEIKDEIRELEEKIFTYKKEDERKAKRRCE